MDVASYPQKTKMPIFELKWTILLSKKVSKNRNHLLNNTDSADTLLLLSKYSHIKESKNAYHFRYLRTSRNVNYRHYQ